jgi:hypothetical protein
MAGKARRRAWTATDVRDLKSLAKKKTPAGRIAKSLKRTVGATRQKAFCLGKALFVSEKFVRSHGGQRCRGRQSLGVPINLGLWSDSRDGRAAGKLQFRIFPGKGATYMQPRSSIDTLRPINYLISCQNLSKELPGPLPAGERSDRECNPGEGDPLFRRIGPPRPEYARKARTFLSPAERADASARRGEDPLN